MKPKHKFTIRTSDIEHIADIENWLLYNEYCNNGESGVMQCGDPGGENFLMIANLRLTAAEATHFKLAFDVSEFDYEPIVEAQ